MSDIFSEASEGKSNSKGERMRFKLSMEKIGYYFVLEKSPIQLYFLGFRPNGDYETVYESSIKKCKR